MKYEAVIFDLDGTLLDTLQDLADSVNRVLEQRGLPAHEVDAYRWFVGDGAAALVRRALPEEERNEETVTSCLEAFRDEYSRGWNAKTRPYEGVPEMLDLLVVSGVRMAVLSNKPDEFTKLCVEEFLPRWEFEGVEGQREGVPGKPDPAGAIEIARRLGIPEENIAYLGDTGTDMVTAVRAGMFPIGALWGFRTEEELRENGAERVISSPVDLLEVIGL